MQEDELIVMVKRLQQELSERDARIAVLESRIRILETPYDPARNGPWWGRVKVA